MKKFLCLSLVFVLIINSCKKELLTSSPVFKRAVETKSFSEVIKKINIDQLGALKNCFITNNTRFQSTTIPELYNNFEIYKDSVKIVTHDNKVSYVFAVKLSSPKAVLFQNLTIEEINGVTYAFVTTYHPSKKWISNRKAGISQQFDGEIDFKRINLNNLKVTGMTNGLKQQKFSSINPSNMYASIEICVSYYVIEDVEHLCAEGLHGIYDQTCPLMNNHLPGQAYVSSELVHKTDCEWFTDFSSGDGNNDDTPPGNGTDPGYGGGTTPYVPEPYTPCDEILVSVHIEKNGRLQVLPPSDCDDNVPTSPTSPTNSDVAQAIAHKPFALFNDVPCEILRKWLTLAKFKPSQSVIDKLNSVAFTYSQRAYQGITVTDVARIQKIDDAFSTVTNMDYFGVKVTQMPIVNNIRLTPMQFLNFIRLHINDFATGTDWAPYNDYGVNDNMLWNSNSPVGAIIALDFPLFDNGSVVTSYFANDKWTFTTIHEPKYGDHPVSGNRDFGYISNQDGSFTFYTRGVDRLTNFDTTVAQQYFSIPFNQADALWKRFQDNIKSFVDSNGGGSGDLIKETYRPNWLEVAKVLNGTKPLSYLSKDCPD